MILFCTFFKGSITTTLQSNLKSCFSIPFATIVFSMVIQQECQLNIGILDETLALATQTQASPNFQEGINPMPRKKIKEATHSLQKDQSYCENMIL